MFSEPKPLDPEIVAEAERLALEGADREAVLGFLRGKGFDKIDTIKTVRPLYGLSMQQAKELIDESRTWSDRYQQDADFHELAERVLREETAFNDPDPPKSKP
jgi:ribosomal protein L7/L12